MEDESITTRTPPTRVGRYAIYGEFARGGTATVHFGRLVGPGGFARTVAIKMLRPSFAEEPEFTRMLIDEARLVSRISHQCIVPTLDVLVWNSVTYIVMDYVRGVPLSLLFTRARARRQGVDPCIVAAVVANVLHGLHAAHEARDELGKSLRVVHRDVSPQNILVGADGVARLLDFGIAKAVTATQATRSGYIKGKIAYMAPEQFAGGDVDRRADVFATAVVLWELLTGERLFGGGTITGAIRKITAGEDEPPSARAPGTGAAWDLLTLRGLQRDRELRFATAREMALELEASSPMAPASEIGEWVRELAGDLLDARDEELRKIEACSRADMDGAVEGPDAAALAAARRRSLLRAGEVTEVDLPPPPADAGPAVETVQGSQADPEVGGEVSDPIGDPQGPTADAPDDESSEPAGVEDGDEEGDPLADDGAAEPSSVRDDAVRERAPDGPEEEDDRDDESEEDDTDDDGEGEGDETGDDDARDDDGDPRDEDTLRFRIRRGLTRLLGLSTILLALSFGVERVTGKPISVLARAWASSLAAPPAEPSAEPGAATGVPTGTMPSALPVSAAVSPALEAVDAGVTPDRRSGAGAREEGRDPPRLAASEPPPAADARPTPRRAGRVEARRSQKVDCEPPYRVDAAGVTIFRWECL